MKRLELCRYGGKAITDYSEKFDNIYGDIVRKMLTKQFEYRVSRDGASATMMEEHLYIYALLQMSKLDMVDEYLELKDFLMK